MKSQVEPAQWNTMWNANFPGQIDMPVQFSDALPPSNEFLVEGHVFQAVEVGHTDTKDTTVLYVPDLKLAVCGDVVYGDVHQLLLEANTKEKRAEWISAIEKVRELKPETVVAGHKRPGSLDGVYNLDASQEYIRNFERLLESSQSMEQLFEGMMKIYPNRLNTRPLMSSCKAAFAAKQVP
jgi:glyoxylase-like metal-dependent hydrolase (beta-lactamase superfamily II)